MSYLYSYLTKYFGLNSFHMRHKTSYSKLHVIGKMFLRLFPSVNRKLKRCLSAQIKYSNVCDPCAAGVATISETESIGDERETF